MTAFPNRLSCKWIKLCSLIFISLWKFERSPYLCILDWDRTFTNSNQLNRQLISHWYDIQLHFICRFPAVGENLFGMKATCFTLGLRCSIHYYKMTTYMTRRQNWINMQNDGKFLSEKFAFNSLKNSRFACQVVSIFIQRGDYSHNGNRGFRKIPYPRQQSKWHFAE